MEESEKGAYLLLDFNGKLTTDIFKEKVFIKVINLEKKNPLVQINDLTFKGNKIKCTKTYNTNFFNLFRNI